MQLSDRGRAACLAIAPSLPSDLILQGRAMAPSSTWPQIKAVCRLDLVGQVRTHTRLGGELAPAGNRRADFLTIALASGWGSAGRRQASPRTRTIALAVRRHLVRCCQSPSGLYAEGVLSTIDLRLTIISWMCACIRCSMRSKAASWACRDVAALGLGAARFQVGNCAGR